MKKLIIPFLFLLLACYKPEETITADDVFPSGIDLSNDSLLANGSDNCTVTVYLPDETKEGVKITFSCEKGGFGPDGLKTIDIPVEKNEGQWLTQTIYTSPLKAGSDEIKASISKYSITRDIELTFNNADSIEITADSVGIRRSPTSDLLFTLQLFAASGKPSIGNETNFKVVDAAGQEVGTVFNPSPESNADGKCSFSYSLLPDLDAIEPLYAIGSLTNTPSDADTLLIFIYP
jgi:hypothetical protein